MEIVRPALAGTLESSDVQICLEPNPGGGIALELSSPVLAQFGNAIRRTVHQTLERYGVTDARVTLRDQGALDCVIQARMRCAIFRGADARYDWSQEDS